MKLNKATIEEFESVIAFYDDVTERTPDMGRFARWQKGKHPTTDGIRAYIEEGSMYVYKADDAIVGAMALTMYQGNDYHAIEWSRQVADDEVAVIHLNSEASSICMPRIPAGQTFISLSTESKFKG